MELLRALATSSNGCIVGEGRGEGVSHGFVLTPLSPGVPTRVIGQPADVTVGWGESFTLKVVATGSTPMTIAWQRGGQPFPNADGDTLTLTNATAFEAGVYRAAISNAFGDALSREAVVTVLDPHWTALTFAGQRLEGAAGASSRIEP